MGSKKKESPDVKGGNNGGQEGKGGKGGKGKKEDLPPPADELSPAEEQLPPEKLFCPPAVVTPEFVYNRELTLEQLQEIYALSGNLEDAARHLAVILGIGDCVFDARNLILLEYCLGNLMFSKQAGLNLNQSLEIYDMGHMILDLIRAGCPFGDAEVLFKNRLLSRSLVKYKTVASDSTGKENDQPKQNDQPKESDQLKEEDKPKDGKKQKETKKSKDPEETKESKKSKKAKNPTEADKLDDAKKDAKLEGPPKDENIDEPLFSRLDVKKITPYFISTVFQHFCLYQYCFTKVHYNIRRTETVFVQTALTYPLSEAKSEEEVKADEAARIAAEEKARQDAYAEQWWAEQSVLDSIMAEAKRLADEELARSALTLDEYIERAVRHRIEEAKKELFEEYEYREHFLIEKIIQRQKEQAAAGAAAAALKANAVATEKTPPVALGVAVSDKKKKKGK